MINKALALIRPFGHHVLGIYVNERFSPFKSIYYLASDIKQEDWSWLKLSRVKLVKLHVQPAFLLDPLKIVRGSYGLGSWAYLRDLEKNIVQVNIIDSSEVYTFFTYQSVKVAKKLHKPIAVDVVESIPTHLTSKIIPYSLITKYVLENADLLVALTKKAEEYLISIGAEEGKIKQIYPGIDLEMFKPSNNKIIDEKVRILFVGALVENKGVLILLEAFKRLIAEYQSRVELWIAGDGPLRPYVELYGRKYPLRFLGKVSWRKLPEVYRNCDIFCFPSLDKYFLKTKIWEEQFGIVLVEAMASGLSIVATNCGAIPEVISSSNFIVKQGSSEQLHNVLRILIEDEKLRMRIGSMNRKRAEEFFNGRKQCLTYAKELNKLT
jgi:glycosyltransferase involved in cell wall biosynthesis